ncbi:MAG: copper resistance CopC family protein [Ktedonobacterales bacterium]
MRLQRQNRMGTLAMTLGIVLIGALSLFLTPATASAHAAYGSSDPAPGATLKAAPTTVTIHFLENVNPSGSDIVVLDATGKQVSTAPAKVDPNDLKTMTVSMQGNDSETYLVQWHNVSADDGDPDIGAFNFTVNPQSTGSTPTPTPTTSSPNTATSSSGVPVWGTVLVGLLGLVVGAGATFALRRK